VIMINDSRCLAYSAGKVTPPAGCSPESAPQGPRRGPSQPAWRRR
jgi:hypothetical protein